MYFATIYESPIGPLQLACDEENLLGLWIAGQKYFGGTIPGSLVSHDKAPVFSLARSWLDEYFAGKQPPLSDLPYAPIGSSFRQIVWGLLCKIPYGETTTYGELAKAVASLTGTATMSSQAVGGAVGRNPISIIIPCHRVVGTNGSLTGYAGGIRKKIHLLEHEGALQASFFIPQKGTAL